MGIGRLVQKGIRALVPRGYDFTEQFELLAKQSEHAASCLQGMFLNPERAKDLFKKLQQIEKTADGHARLIHENLRTTFITPLDREDISSLARQLDEVVDLLESAGLNVEIAAQDPDMFRAPVHKNPFLVETAHQMYLLCDATKILPQAMRALCGVDGGWPEHDIEIIQKRIHELEQKADAWWENVKRTRFDILQRKEKSNESLTATDMKVLLWAEHICHPLENCMDTLKQTVDHTSDIIAKFG